mmetsp:Transcript_26254/g.75806  ORF Transcript_26254/g.75806 Transcript_26254/m.75806 type:complete len:386 (+) Transcript_26254:552-1709(+)
MKRKHQSQGRQRLFSARKVGNVLPRLFRRTDREDNTLREGIEGVHQLELRVSSQGNHLIHLLELERNLPESIHEHLETQPSELFMLPSCFVPVLGNLVQIRNLGQIVHLLLTVVFDSTHIGILGNRIALLFESGNIPLEIFCIVLLERTLGESRKRLPTRGRVGFLALTTGAVVLVLLVIFLHGVIAIRSFLTLLAVVLRSSSSAGRLILILRFIIALIVREVIGIIILIGLMKLSDLIVPMLDAPVAIPGKLLEVVELRNELNLNTLELGLHLLELFRLLRHGFELRPLFGFDHFDIFIRHEHSLGTLLELLPFRHLVLHRLLGFLQIFLRRLGSLLSLLGSLLRTRNGNLGGAELLASLILKIQCLLAGILLLLQLGSTGIED